MVHLQLFTELAREDLLATEVIQYPYYFTGNGSLS
jgi:hypothetical protein